MNSLQQQQQAIGNYNYTTLRTDLLRVAIISVAKTTSVLLLLFHLQCRVISGAYPTYKNERDFVVTTGINPITIIIVVAAHGRRHLAHGMQNKLFGMGVQ